MEIKGVKLSEHQQQTLMEGKPLHLEGMTSTKGKPFDADVQFNADKRYVEFLFDRSTTKEIQPSVAQDGTMEASKVFRDKELTEEQHQQLKDGQTVYVDGLLDKKDKPYQGYITFNKETGKTDFAFKNPEALKDKIVPAEAHKTQTAVNSDGKTNESTKNIKEPLKSGQNSPDNKKQQKPKPPAKSKGRSV